ncbi:hypothetical protein [Ferrovibrio terrae]|nr:hypothetical protein [Ferrovibrio terrae]
MKAFVAGLVAALIIAIGAAFILQTVNKPADVAFSTGGARVTHEHQN